MFFRTSQLGCLKRNAYQVVCQTQVLHLTPDTADTADTLEADCYIQIS